MVTISKVDYVGMEDIFNTLQLVCLPEDEPYPDGDNVIWWIANDNNTLAGFASLTRLDNDSAYLSRAGVVDEFRGMGIQKRLIRARINHARKLGLQSIVTDCTTVNCASANSLISCGFKLYWPENPWALPDSIYWILRL